MCASNESLLPRITPRILNWLETWTRVPATLTVEVIGRERTWTLGSAKHDCLSSVLTRYSTTRYGWSRDKARVWQLECRNYLWIWRHRGDCHQHTSSSSVCLSCQAIRRLLRQHCEVLSVRLVVGWGDNPHTDAAGGHMNWQHVQWVRWIGKKA